MIVVCCDGSAFKFLETFRRIILIFIPQHKQVAANISSLRLIMYNSDDMFPADCTTHCFSYLKSNLVYLLLTKACRLADMCSSRCMRSHTFLVCYSLSLSSQRPWQPWTSASFPKRKVHVPSLSWSGTTMPPARAARASGTEAAAETGTALTRTSSVWGLVGNQVHVLFIVVVMHDGKHLSESSTMDFAAGWVLFSKGYIEQVPINTSINHRE